jgi:hypothetical protein
MRRGACRSGTPTPRSSGACVPDEVQGQRFIELDIGFPVERRAEPIRQAALDGAEPFDENVEAVTRRGQTVQCRVRTLPLRDGGGEASGTIILMAAGDWAPMSF